MPMLVAYPDSDSSASKSDAGSADLDTASAGPSTLSQEKGTAASAQSRAGRTISELAKTGSPPPERNASGSGAGTGPGTRRTTGPAGKTGAGSGSGRGRGRGRGPESRKEVERLPPLPRAFHDLYASNVRAGTVDDPALHAGRRRQIPHLEGHWPTHVSLEWHPLPACTTILSRLVDAVASPSPSTKMEFEVDASSKAVHSLLLSDLGAPLPLHISLSRTLSLQTQEREPFLSRLKAGIARAGLAAFEVSFEDVAWFPNYEGTRSFLSLSAARPAGNELNRLLGVCNRVCHGMGMPMLYEREAAGGESAGKKRRKGGAGVACVVEGGRDESQEEAPECDESFHVSLAWSLRLMDLGPDSRKSLKCSLRGLSVSFDAVKVKIGNTVHSIPLSGMMKNKKHEKRNEAK